MVVQVFRITDLDPQQLFNSTSEHEDVERCGQRSTLPTSRALKRGEVRKCGVENISNKW